jgi:hypothetical protein
MSNEELMGSAPFIELVDHMIEDLWEVISNTQLEHVKRTRAFVMLTMVLSMTPDDNYPRVQEMLQQKLYALGPVDMINTIHVLADSMSTVLAMGFNPPPGTFGGLG